MSYKRNAIHKEAESVRRRNLTPVTQLRLGDTVPTPNKLHQQLQIILIETKPSLLIVDSKESSAIPGTYSFETYTSLLEEACTVCHSHGVACTNGGLEDWAVINYYLSTLDDDPVEYQKILETLPRKHRKEIGSPKTQKSAARVREYLKHYQTLPIDYINIIWGEYPVWIFGNIAEFIHTALKKNVISTEMTIPSDKQVRDETLMYIRKMRLDYVIWRFPQEEVKRSDIMDKDGNLTDTAKSVRNVNRSLI